MQLHRIAAKEPVSPIEEIFRFDEFELNPTRVELKRAGQLLTVDALVLRLLACLVRRPGQLVTKDELVTEVWDGRAIADNAITVAMARLRKALGDGRDREFVATVYGHGYRFMRDVSLEKLHVGRRVSSAVARAPEAAPPFVGRERLVAALVRAQQESSARRGRACVLFGEPGIGKTRAVEAFEQELSDGQAQVYWGYCREGSDSPPLWPWLQLLRRVIAGCDRRELDRALGPAALEVLEYCGELPRGQAPQHQSEWSGPGRHRGFDAILRAFAFAAEQQPLVLVLDDLHSADAPSLELFGQLLDEIGRTRILVITTTRHAASHGEHGALLARVVGHRSCERHLLERLRREEVISYVGSILTDPDQQLAAAVFAKSEGNPFFMVELARQLRATDQPDASALAVSDAALDLVRQRVAQLDTEARGVLSAAAVMGRSFELPLLQTITGREPNELVRCLDEALAVEVIIAAPDSVTDFAFRHELLRRVLYDALTPSTRRRWHIRVAEALETRAHAGGAVPPSELAYHFYSGLPESDLRKTIDYCRRAASASSHYGNPDVVRYLHHALDALALVDNGSLRLRMSLLLASVLYARGCAHRQYLPLLQETLRLAHEQGDATTLVRAGHMLDPHPGFQPLPGVREHMTRALELLPPSAVGPRALAMASLACAAPECFSALRSHARMAEAEVLAHASGATMEREGTLLRKLYLMGGPDHAQIAASITERLEKLALNEPQRFPIVPVDMAYVRAIDASQHGDASAARDSLEQALARSRQLRHIELIWHSERLQAIDAINRGSTAAGSGALMRLHRQAEEVQILGSAPYCAFDRVVVLGEFGRSSQEVGDVLTPLLRDTSDPVALWSLKIRALAMAGFVRDARVALEAVSPSALADLPCDRDYLGSLAHLARAVLVLDLPEYNDALYALLSKYTDFYSADIAFYSEGSVAQLLGMLDQARGRHAAASAHFKRAVRMSLTADLLPRAAEARVQLAESLLAQDRAQLGRRARTLLQRARSDAQALQLPLIGQAAEAAL
ncbi:MAG: AAA family ATPase, partial [Polyangiales bacterium]